ncbi:MAG: glutathione S-transferase family protein [Kofleriaceae bacterium]
MTLTLHVLPGLDRVLSLSPFSMKVEIYLRMTGVAYERVVGLDASVGPKQKLPFIELDGVRLGDSYFILEHLRRVYGDSLDAGLTARDRAIALAVTRMVDEHLYWALLHSRWLDARFAPRIANVFFGGLPEKTRAVYLAAATEAFAKTLHAQGMGRHTPAEIAARASADIAAIAALLGDAAFMLGAEPRSLDATVYAFLANVLDVDMATTLQQATEAHPTLVAYAARMRARYES